MSEHAAGRSICVVIPTMGDRPEWLRTCIKSITRQGLAEDLLVRIVTPNASLVGSLVVGVGVDVLERPARGLADAIFFGWQDLPDTIRFVTWLGDDDALAPNSLRSTAGVLNDDAKAAFVFGRVRYIDGQGNTMWLQRSFKLAPRYSMYGKNFVPQQGCLFRWQMVRAVGSVDVGLRTAMDQDLFCKLLAVGRGRYIPVELAAYRWHATNLTVLKGNQGNSESDLVRSRYGSSMGRAFRPVLSLVDRFAYKIMRSLPAGDAPKIPDANGATYFSAEQ